MGSGAPSAALSSRMQGRKPTRIEGQGNKGTRDNKSERGGATRERKKEGRRSEATSPQRKGPPPYGQGKSISSPHHKFAPKNQQKVTWGALKKISEKFFGGMFRGKKNPLRYLNGRGLVLISLTNNENRDK